MTFAIRAKVPEVDPAIPSAHAAGSTHPQATPCAPVETGRAKVPLCKKHSEAFKLYCKKHHEALCFFFILPDGEHHSCNTANDVGELSKFGVPKIVTYLQDFKSPPSSPSSAYLDNLRESASQFSSAVELVWVRKKERLELEQQISAQCGNKERPPVGMPLPQLLSWLEKANVSNVESQLSTAKRLSEPWLTLQKQAFSLLKVRLPVHFDFHAR